MNMGIGHWALAMWRAWDFLPFHLKRIKLCFIPSCLQSLILNPKMPAHFNDNVMMTTTPCSVSWEVLFCAARAKALHQTGWLIFHKMSMCVISISESSFDNLLVSTKLKIYHVFYVTHLMFKGFKWPVFAISFQSKMPPKQRKIAVMGSRSVGKSSLAIQFAQVCYTLLFK